MSTRSTDRMPSNTSKTQICNSISGMGGTKVLGVGIWWRDIEDMKIV